MTIVALALCIGAAAWPRSRRAVARAFGRSRVLRGVDALLWNLALLLAVGELAFGIAAHFVSSPLLVTPNARSQSRIAESRRQVIEYFGTGNARGYTDREPLADASGVVRIVALGDSFAYGIVGYEANFLTQLEAELAARVGAPVEVVNLGLPNLQPKDYLQLLVDEGLALHPDLVLVCLFAGNDFTKPSNTTYFDGRNWRVVAFAMRLFGFARERERAREAGLAGAEPEGWKTSAGTFSEEAYFGVARSYVPLLRRAPSEAIRRADEATLSILAELVAVAAPTPVAVAVLPDELQVNPELRASVLAALGLSEDDLDLERPARVTREGLEARGVAVIDLLPALVAAEREAPTYAPRDSHWNARGNAIAARVIAAGLEASVRRIATARSLRAAASASADPAGDRR